jgi:uncharacterized protein (TIGR03089 family)
VPASTFAALLDEQLRADPGRPLVTFYDDATGERVELSVVTYSNWVAKTAGLVQDELGLTRGDRVLVDLPVHWLTPVWLGAAWSVGAVASPAGHDAGAPDLVVCGPDGVGRYAGGSAPVVALSLLPMGARFTTPLPDGVVDYGAVVWGQPDAFFAEDPPDAADEGWRGAVALTQGDLAVGGGSDDATTGSRLLTDLSPASDEGLPCFLGPLAAAGGTVWVAHPDPDGWDRRAASEHATAQVRAGGPAGQPRS